MDFLANHAELRLYAATRWVVPSRLSKLRHFEQKSSEFFLPATVIL
jgi:hypothetical protein